MLIVRARKYKIIIYKVRHPAFKQQLRGRGAHFVRMTTAALNHSKIQKNIRVSSVLAVFPKVNWKAVCFATFSICLLLLFYYVWQVKYLTKGSYLINSYEKEVGKLLSEKNDLEVSFAENSFLGQVRQKIQSLNFEKTTAVRYIQLPDNYLASVK